MSETPKEKDKPVDLSKENTSLRERLAAAEKEILRLQNVATNLEITVRTQASLIQGAQLLQAPSK